jgi:hypothetical protein
MDKLNKKLCDEWNLNKNKNPITKRTIKPDGAIYKSILNKCSKINNDKKELNQDDLCKKWKLDKTKNPETRRIIKVNGPIYNKFLKLCGENEIKHDNDNDNDNDRINFFKFMNKILSDINNKNANNCVNCDINKNCKIGNFIKIGDLLSSNSASGVVYKTNINDKDVCVKIVNDYVPLHNKKNETDIHAEIRTLEFLTKYVIKTEFPHFPITYDVLKCNRELLDKYDNIPDDIMLIYNQFKKKGNILMIMSELADGSLKTFYKNEIKEDYKNKKLLLNAFGQIFVSLIFFHKIMNAFHNDPHSGNFLFRKIPSGGYYHYNIYGKDYYIENLGYVWEIWDFGQIIAFSNSEEINKQRIDIIKEPLFSFKYKKPRKLDLYFSRDSSTLNVIFDYHYKISDENYLISLFPENSDTKYLYDFFNEFKLGKNLINKNSSLNPLDIKKMDNSVLELMLKNNFIKDKINNNDKIINNIPYTI